MGEGRIALRIVGGPRAPGKRSCVHRRAHRRRKPRGRYPARPRSHPAALHGCSVRESLTMLKTLIGDYPVTRQFRTRTDRFEFAQYQGSVATAFKRVVRNLEFDVAEMAIMTFLVAKAFNKPYRLLPFVVMARFQHPYLVYDASRGELRPEGLTGKRVGVRSYSVTTGAWIRGILAEDYGIGPAQVNWVTFEEAHVAEFRDPP